MDTRNIAFLSTAYRALSQCPGYAVGNLADQILDLLDKEIQKGKEEQQKDESTYTIPPRKPTIDDEIPF